MQIIDPSIEVENFNGLKIMKNIEKACRTCYRSEGAITEDSYKKLLTNCITRGHESILEHEKISVRMICSINTYKDLTRHRFASFSIESTRYCAYNKDKFENSIKFINPIYITDSNNYKTWCECMMEIEMCYMLMANRGAKPDECRTLLPHSVAAEVCMTCNIREWKHILSLRCSKAVHPEIRQLLIPLLLKFKIEMPEIFGTIAYDEDFPKEWYAKLTVMNNE